ncbi:ATP-binding protein [Desulfosporosinus sp. SB140]|uniref:ATP-binding protein n=1 Tax=Desulfosporosinus paludis TaxID=3115649 RepID=UPI00388E4334
MGDGVENLGFPVELLNKSVLERRDYFSNYIIPHPFLKQAVKDTVSKIGSIRSERIVFVCGPTGVGKKELVNKVTTRLIELAKPKLLSNKGCIPVVNVEASAPDSGNFNFPKLWSSALRSMKEPISDANFNEVINTEGERVVLSRIKKGDMREVLEDVLQYRQSSALIINEAHHLLRVSSGKKANWEVDVIKSLANKSQTPIVLVGTYELTTFLEDLDKSLTDQVNRRTSIVEFPRYRHDTKSQVEMFGNTIIQLLRHMPLEKTAEALVKHDFMYFYKYTLGCAGSLKDWLNSAYDLALQEQTVTLTKKHLDETRISGHRSMGMLKSITDGERKMAIIQSDGDIDTALGINKENKEATKKLTPKAKKRTLPGIRNPKRDAVG